MQNKVRMIDANALKNEMVSDLANTMRMREKHKGYMAVRVLDKIDEAPTIDAVPVVRCKDCLHYREGKIIPGVKFCFRLNGKDGKTPVGYNFSPDDFCSRGVKKDGGASNG